MQKICRNLYISDNIFYFKKKQQFFKISEENWLQQKDWKKIDISWRNYFQPNIKKTEQNKVGVFNNQNQTTLWSSFTQSILTAVNYNCLLNNISTDKEFKISSILATIVEKEFKLSIPELSQKIHFNFIFLTVEKKIPVPVMYFPYNDNYQTIILNLDYSNYHVSLVGIYNLNVIHTIINTDFINSLIPALIQNIYNKNTFLKKKPTFKGQFKEDIIKKNTDISKIVKKEVTLHF